MWVAFRRRRFPGKECQMRIHCDDRIENCTGASSDLTTHALVMNVWRTSEPSGIRPAEDLGSRIVQLARVAAARHLALAVGTQQRSDS